MGIPNKLKKVREQAGLTQSELAIKANVARTLIVGIENGTVSVVRTSTLTKISDALGKKVVSIFFTA
mgnify:CR=1 FL=1